MSINNNEFNNITELGTHTNTQIAKLQLRTTQAGSRLHNMPLFRILYYTKNINDQAQDTRRHKQ